jgi:predicted methyltransferase
MVKMAAMRQAKMTSRWFAIASVALALSAGACGKKKSKAAAGAGAAAGTAAGSTTGSAAPAAGGAAGPAAGAGSGSQEAPPPVLTSTTPQAAVDWPDRPAEDKALDAGRKPVELITFLGIGRGMKLGEVMTGGGYTAELLARVVGPEGEMWAQNNQALLDMFAEKPWSERLARAKMPWLLRVDRELTDPFPPEAKNLDLVVMNLTYHDAVAAGADRAAMNNGVWKALRAGGGYAIIDHSAKEGSGEAAAKELHRIDPKLVEAEVVKAGFILDRTSSMYENPKDTRDWNASPGAAADKRGTSDRFVLVFRKQTGQ